MILIYITILLLPPLIRYMTSQPLMTGTLAYYHTRIATYFLTNGPLYHDPLSPNNRLIILTPYHALLSLTSTILPPSTAALLITFLAQAISLIILNKLLTNSHLKHAYLFLYTTSITVLSTTIMPTPTPLTITLLLAAILAYQKKKPNTSFALLILLSIHGALSALISTATHYYLNQHKKKQPSPAHNTTLLILLAITTIININTTLPNITEQPFAELGSTTSTTIPLIILAVIGLFINPYKKQHYSLTMFATTLIIYAFINNNALPYANLAIIFFAANTLHSLHKHQFSTPLRPIFLIFLYAGLLTQPAFFILDTPHHNPQAYLPEILLAATASKPTKILTDTKTGPIVQYYTDTKVTHDLTPSPSHNAYTAQELTQLTQELDRLQTTHILLTPELQTQHPRFATLLQNNETFKNIIHRKGYRFYNYK